MKQTSGPLFKAFMHGKIDREELNRKMIQLEKEALEDPGLTYEVDMVDLISKEGKTARHYWVD
jgi:hypothetical protein